MAKYWSFSFSISASNEYSGLISFRIDWFDFLAIQGTLKSLLQHYSSKESILPCSAFFMVQLSYPYMTTGETTALTIQIFVGKVMSLLFKMLSNDFIHLKMCSHIYTSLMYIYLMIFPTLTLVLYNQFPEFLAVIIRISIYVLCRA